MDKFGHPLPKQKLDQRFPLPNHYYPHDLHRENFHRVSTFVLYHMETSYQYFRYEPPGRQIQIFSYTSCEFILLLVPFRAE